MADDVLSYLTIEVAQLFQVSMNLLNELSDLVRHRSGVCPNGLTWHDLRLAQNHICCLWKEVEVGVGMERHLSYVLIMMAR